MRTRLISSNTGAREPLSPAIISVLRELRIELARNGRSEPGDTELRECLDASCARVGLHLSAYERELALAQVEKENQPFGLLQPLIDDTSVTDIIVSAFDRIDVQRSRSNRRSAITFPDHGAYLNFLERLCLRAGISNSTRSPISDGTIGQFARLNIVHETLCSEGGPYLTIRLNRFMRITADDLIARNLGPARLFDYFARVINSGGTILIAGEVGTGKTTLARTLAQYIPEHESILVIEDTPEIRLDHPHVRYLSTRQPNMESAGEITARQCIKAGMRMGMNRIILGEIRDADAADSLLDVCASGHPGVSTIHARSASDAVARLQLFLSRKQPSATRAVLLEQVGNAVQVIVFLSACSRSGQRFIREVRELGPFADGALRHREIHRTTAKGEADLNCRLEFSAIWNERAVNGRSSLSGSCAP